MSGLFISLENKIMYESVVYNYNIYFVNIVIFAMFVCQNKVTNLSNTKGHFLYK